MEIKTINEIINKEELTHFNKHVKTILTHLYDFSSKGYPFTIRVYHRFHSKQIAYIHLIIIHDIAEIFYHFEDDELEFVKLLFMKEQEKILPDEPEDKCPIQKVLDITNEVIERYIQFMTYLDVQTKE